MIATSCSVTGVAAAPCATNVATSPSVGVATVAALLCAKIASAGLGVGGRAEAAAVPGVFACGVGEREVQLDSDTRTHDVALGVDSSDEAACAVDLPAATAAFTRFAHGSLSYS